VDYLSLLKTDDGWRIVDKIFTRDPTPPANKVTSRQ
jgi:hypothetical protein